MNIFRTIFIVTAVAVLATSLALPAHAARGARAADPPVPSLDVTPVCVPLDNSDMQLDEKRCRESEKEARDQLTREWASFPAANRAQCITTATMGGTASYVELITCLEMLRDVAAPPAKDNNLRTKPTGLQPKQ